MKKFIVSVLLYVIANSMQAQSINYTINDLAQAGEEFHVETKMYEEGNFPQLNSIDPEAWDFSSLTDFNKSTIQVLSKNDFEELTDLPEGTLVLVRNQFKICVLPENDYLKLLGVLANIEEKNIFLPLPTPQKMLHFPLTDGESDETTTEFPVSGKPSDFGQNIPLVDSIRLDISVTNNTVVEGSNTLKTHQQSYEAFKVINSTILTADIWTKVPFIGWKLYKEKAITDSSKNLQYFTPKYGVPVCEISMNWDNEIKFFQIIDENYNNIITNSQTIKAYPNPAVIGDIIHFSNELSNVTIFNAYGQNVIHFERTNAINTNELNSGLYIIRTDNSPQSIKLFIR